MNLTDLQREAHAIAKEHGWWDEGRTFGDLIAEIHEGLSEARKAYRVNGIDSWLERQYPHSRDTQPLTHLDVPEEGDKPAGVASELADVVIRVADMAEHYGVGLDPAESIEDRDALDVCLAGVGSFGDWIARLHWITAEATSYKGVASEHLVINALASLIVGVQLMAAHYGIDLDAAVEAKMEYNRGRSYWHGWKAL